MLAAVRFGVPELIASHVRRHRLQDALAGAERVPLVLVSGPAGSGKTSLVAEWVRGREPAAGPTGWVTFEDGETSFWEYLLECLGRLGLDLAEVEAPAADGVLGRRHLIALATAIAERPERLTVVLDGYELVSPELSREVDFLLRHTLGHLCLVLVGRVDPVLPLYRYRLSDSLLEVRATDLAFTDDEASELLGELGVALPAESVHELNHRIKGWVAGLRFAARALAGQGSPEHFVKTVVTQTCDINEYLLGEVLEAQPRDVRRFLLDTCVPEVVCRPLVEELAGARAGRTLDELTRSNAFIEAVPDQPGCFRYYPFFRELLRAQLAYESPDRMVELHRRTARWLQREGMTERAIAHLAAIGDWGDVAAQVVRGLLVGRLLLEGPQGRLAGVTRQLPSDLDQGSACVVRAAVALHAGDREACAEELAAARRTAREGDEELHLSILVVEAVRASTADNAEAAAALVEKAERRLSETPSHARTPRESELYALVLLGKGVAMLRRGDLRRSRKALTCAIGLDASHRFPAFRAECLGRLALVDALEGYLSRAGRTAGESLTVAGEAGLPPAERSPAALVALACVGLERYELKSAREHVASATVCRSLSGDPLCRPLIEGVVAGLERAGGHLQPALARLEAAATRAASSDPWLAEHLRVEAARLSVASGRPEQALDALAAVGESDESEAAVVVAAAYAEQGQPAPAEKLLARTRKGQPSLSTEVSWLLVEVLQETRRRAPGRARGVLEQSLRLAAPEELRRPFREAGPSVQRLLAADAGLLHEHAWLSHSNGHPKASSHGSPPSYRGRTAPAGPPQSSAEVVETLTAKELEVLGHLEELLTTEEIAEKMFVSVNTVRTHVRSILRKLGVSRRNAAVRKARELGLFDG